MFWLQTIDPSSLDLPDVNRVFTEGSSYLTGQLIPNAIAGDPSSLAVATIGSIILFIILFKMSTVVYALIKRLFLFILIGFSLYFLLLNFESRLAVEGASSQVIILGIVGIGLGLVALIKTIWALKQHARKRAPIPADNAPPFSPTQLQQPQMLSTQAFSASNILSELKSDRSLLSVLSYVIVAEFGVFSSVTQAAPTLEAGVGIAVAFFIGAFVFIRTTYHNYFRGVRHLVIATVFAFFLSLLLGVFWSTQYTLEQLLSLEYFLSPSLVALLTGIAVSLFMGSKN